MSGLESLSAANGLGMPSPASPFSSLIEEIVGKLTPVIEQRIKPLEDKIGNVKPVLDKAAAVATQALEEKTRGIVWDNIQQLYAIGMIAYSVLDEKSISKFMEVYKEQIIDCAIKRSPLPMITVLEKEFGMFLKTKVGIIWLQKFVDAFFGVREEMLK